MTGGLLWSLPWCSGDHRLVVGFPKRPLPASGTSREGGRILRCDGQKHVPVSVTVQVRKESR